MNKCEHCGNYHEGRCPRVKAVEYHLDGSIKRVEYLTPGDYAPVIVSLPGNDTCDPGFYPKTTWGGAFR